MKDTGQEEELPLSKATQLLLEECRMILPGMQALFGFQLIAVFNPRFADVLSFTEQRLHLLAIGLIVVAVALIMAPAAIHRQTTPRRVTQKIFHLSTKLVVWSLPPLALSLCLEFFLVSRIIIGGTGASLFAAILFALFVILWFVLPRMRLVSEPSTPTRGE
jgi:hypothetical protein